MALNAQPGILQPVPTAGRHLFFMLARPSQARAALAALIPLADGDTAVTGLGPQLIQALNQTVPGLREFPARTVSGMDITVPSTPTALWIWLRGTDHGELVLASRRIEQALAPAFSLERVVDTFRYGSGRDLTGYEDGTENPKGDDAIAAALVHGAGAGRDGGSFAGVQQWVHDLDTFERLAPAARDNVIGRRLHDNEELQDAPSSAHVKRTSRESFDPPAFILRCSMPWARDAQAGLLFLAFCQSLDAFEAPLRRMMGEDDGIADALFGFSRPITGAFFWCPPMHEGRLDLSAIGL